MVKHKDAIWSNFELIEDGSNQKAKCLNCSGLVSARSDRLKVHLTKCSENSLTDVEPSASGILPSTPSRKRPIADLFGSPCSTAGKNH